MSVQLLRGGNLEKSVIEGVEIEELEAVEEGFEEVEVVREEDEAEVLGWEVETGVAEFAPGVGVRLVVQVWLRPSRRFDSPSILQSHQSATSGRIPRCAYSCFRLTAIEPPTAAAMTARTVMIASAVLRKITADFWRRCCVGAERLL